MMSSSFDISVRYKYGATTRHCIIFTTLQMLARLSLVLFLFISIASASSIMGSLMTDFVVPCESALCSDSEVASFIKEVETLLPSANIYLVQVWAHEVTLLLCSDSNLLTNLNEINSIATITSIRPSDHCAVYESL